MVVMLFFVEMGGAVLWGGAQSLDNWSAVLTLQDWVGGCLDWATSRSLQVVASAAGAVEAEPASVCVCARAWEGQAQRGPG